MDDATLPLDEFLADIASERVAPAGGSGAAVAGAIGTALCEMVCIHTVRADANGAAETDLSDVRDELGTERDRLLRLASTDAGVVDDLFVGPAEDLDRAAVERAVDVPLAIAESCMTVLELATAVTEHGTSNAVLDAGSGVELVHGALRASVLTVRGTVDRLSGTKFAIEVERDVSELETRADAAVATALDTVESRT